jgi:hypothetical protein
MRRLLLLPLLPFLLASSNETQPRKAEHKFRLELHVPSQSGIYFSAWGEGDVITDHDGSDGKTVLYRRRLYWYDNCEWEASEKLVPTAKDKYDYQYRETPVRCPKGSTADVNSTTPRDGKVTVHKLDQDLPLTPLVAWSKGWDTPPRSR